jgi:endonuclease I
LNVLFAHCDFRSMKNLPVRLLSLGLWLGLVAGAFSQSEPPAAYYNNAIGKTGGTLKTALHDIIKDHTQIPYTASSTDTWDALKVLDEDPTNSNRVVLVYSGYTDLKSAQYNGSTGTWDREHLWPQSFGLVEFDDFSHAKTDIFNLRPIDVNVNTTRSNKYYDTTTTPGSTHPSSPQSTYDSDSWEPRNEDKGFIARAAFYMAVRYDGTDADVPDLELSDTPNSSLYRFGKLTTLLAWNRQFGVTTTERVRNHRIYTDYQHNRNPFIDHPEFADMVFNSVTQNQAWKNLRFTTAELGNASISGDTADIDKDGLSNLVEYTFNRNPRQPDATRLFTTTRNGDGSVQLVFTRNRFASDVTLTYESSTDLHTWTTAAAQVLNTTVTNFENEQLTVRIPGAAPRTFVRVKITRP